MAPIRTPLALLSTLCLSGSLSLVLVACDHADLRATGRQLQAAVARSDGGADHARTLPQGSAVDSDRAARNAARATRTAGANAAAEPKDASGNGTSVTAQAVNAGSNVVTAVADQLKDTTIAAKVTTGIAADSNLSALKIRVESQGGVVTLRGPAPTAAARDRVEEIARNVMGVTTVRNQLSITSG